MLVLRKDAGIYYRYFPDLLRVHVSSLLRRQTTLSVRFPSPPSFRTQRPGLSQHRGSTRTPSSRAGKRRSPCSWGTEARGLRGQAGAAWFDPQAGLLGLCPVPGARHSLSSRPRGTGGVGRSRSGRARSGSGQSSAHRRGDSLPNGLELPALSPSPSHFLGPPESSLCCHPCPRFCVFFKDFI